MREFVRDGQPGQQRRIAALELQARSRPIRRRLKPRGRAHNTRTAKRIRGPARSGPGRRACRKVKTRSWKRCVFPNAHTVALRPAPGWPMTSARLRPKLMGDSFRVWMVTVGGRAVGTGERSLQPLPALPFRFALPPVRRGLAFGAVPGPGGERVSHRPGIEAELHEEVVAGGRDDVEVGVENAVIGRTPVSFRAARGF